MKRKGALGLRMETDNPQVQVVAEGKKTKGKPMGELKGHLGSIYSKSSMSVLTITYSEGTFIILTL